MKTYPKSATVLYIIKVLKKYSDADHILSANEICEKVKEEFGISYESRTVRRYIGLIKEELGYDISTYEENKKGYFISRDPDTDFEPGEIRAIIDTFSLC